MNPNVPNREASPAVPPNPLALPEPWDLVSGAYADISLSYFESFSREALRLANLGPSPRIVDIACGPGTLSLPAAEQGAQVEAIDFSPDMLARLEARLQSLLRVGESGVLKGKVGFRQGDGQSLPYDADSFDGAFSMFGLIFFPDRQAGFREMLRVLKPGGVAIVSSWAPFEGPFVKVIDALREQLPGMPFGTGKAPLGAREEMRQEMRSAGFRNVTVSTFTNAIEAPTLGEFWEKIQQTNAALVLLRRKVGPEKWPSVAHEIHIKLQKELGEGPVKAVGNALLGSGRK